MEWTAHVDHDIVGWNLYRRSPSRGEVRVNAEPIPLSGRSDFAYTDIPGLVGTVNYRLASIGTDGTEHWYGSTSVELSAPIRALSARLRVVALE